MSPLRISSLPVGPLRAFESLSRNLNFRVAGEELHLTQPAITRQIKVLEGQLGAVLFQRSKRGVQLTPAGATLLQVAAPWLAQLDMTVRQIRQGEGRRVVSISTFASMASLWLIPRLERFHRRHDVDVRVLAREQILPTEAAGGQGDIALRYCHADEAPPGAVQLFEERLTPVASPALLLRSRRSGKALRQPEDLSYQTLIEDSDLLPSGEYRSWYQWLRRQGKVDLQPRRWLFFNLAHQQIQAALAGQGVALGRLPFVVDHLATGDLVQLFANRRSARLSAPYSYWLIGPSNGAVGEEISALQNWLLEEAALTRAAVAEQLL